MRKEIYDFLREEEIPTLLEYALVYAYDHKGEQYVSLEGHKLIEDRLMDVVFKATKKNLMICMPPGFGKSELAIKIFISWIYSFLPDSQFIVAANTLSLAASHVKAIRDINSLGLVSVIFRKVWRQNRQKKKSNKK